MYRRKHAPSSEERKKEEGRGEGGEEKERKTVFSHERPRRINVSLEGRRLERTVTLRRLAVVTETVTAGELRDHLTGRI